MGEVRYVPQGVEGLAKKATRREGEDDGSLGMKGARARTMTRCR